MANAILFIVRRSPSQDKRKFILCRIKYIAWLKEMKSLGSTWGKSLVNSGWIKSVLCLGDLVLDTILKNVFFGGPMGMPFTSIQILLYWFLKKLIVPINYFEKTWWLGNCLIQKRNSSWIIRILNLWPHHINLSIIL